MLTQWCQVDRDDTFQGCVVKKGSIYQFVLKLITYQYTNIQQLSSVKHYINNTISSQYIYQIVCFCHKMHKLKGDITEILLMLV